MTVGGLTKALHQSCQTYLYSTEPLNFADALVALVGHFEIQLSMGIDLPRLVRSALVL